MKHSRLHGDLPRISFASLRERIKDAYTSDMRPWVIGYSGGKDSTCTLQLIWTALLELDRKQLRKPVFVLSSDTLVETPVIVNYIDNTLRNINSAAVEQDLPIQAKKVVPNIRDSFWVNLIGRGYPAPTQRFRWCTERLKINPANDFIKKQVARYGEVVMVLGVRKAESATRAQVMALHRISGTAFSRHSSLPGAFVFTPIEALSVDDIWSYLLQHPSPWGGDNRQLLTMYRNAAGECPLVVDKNTESCGNSRFGCWVCTVVTKDKAMEAMVDNGEEWLEPLLDLRDRLAETQTPDRKSEFRDHRRRTGQVTFVKGRDTPIPGPYKLEFREEILRSLLKAQKHVAANAPPGEKTVLILDEELIEIQRIWRAENGDWANTVLQIIKDYFGREMSMPASDTFEFSSTDKTILEKVCQKYHVPTQMVTQLLDVERAMRGLKRRARIHQSISTILEKEWRSETEVIEERKRQLTSSKGELSFSTYDH